MSFWSELKRRNVFKVGAAYAIVAWLLLQVASIVLPTFAAPGWVMPAFTLFLALGFPVALILAWAYEITPEGVQKTRAVPPEESVRQLTGQRLNYVVTALLALGVAVLVVDNYLIGDGASRGPNPERAIGNATDGESSRAASGQRRSIAVLPFESRSALAEDEFFVGGLHDDVLTQLAGISGLRVISRTSVMEYRDRNRNLREIGEALGVDAILEGGIQRAGDTVRMNFQLIDAVTDEHLWADRYDRELTAANVLAIQSEMAAAIAAALETELTPEEASRLESRPTLNTVAYERYLSGREYLAQAQLEPRLFRIAAREFQAAVEEDSEFALAWSSLARAHLMLYWTGIDSSTERREMARAAVERALAIDPELPQAHLARGHYLYHGLLDYEGALAELAIAERGMPGSVDVLDMQTAVYRRLGDWDRVVALMERVAEIDPRAARYFEDFGRVYFVLGDYDTAERYFDEALAIAPEFGPAHAAKAWIPLLRDGDAAAAIARAEEAATIVGPGSVVSVSISSALYQRDYAAAIRYLEQARLQAPLAAVVSGLIYQLAGDEARAAERIAAVREQFARGPRPEDVESAGQDSESSGQAALYMAAMEALAGEPERALELAQPALDGFARDAWASANRRGDVILSVLIPAGAIDQAFAELDVYFSTGAIWTVEALVADPRFDPIRDDPRTAALIERYGRR